MQARVTRKPTTTPGALEDRRLAGQVAVITGAGRGIGRAVALRFAAAGASVVCAARNARELDETVRAVERQRGQARRVIADVRDEEAVEAMMDEAVDAYGSLDIVVLNAGIMPAHESVEEISPEVWRECMDTNVTGVFLGLRAAVPHLRAAGGGKIIVMGSGAARRAPNGLGAYATSKAAVTALVRVASRDLRADSIAVNELQPGPTATRLHGVQESDPDTLADRGVVLEEGLEDDRSIEGEWFKSPRNVADAALFLAQMPNHGPSGQILSLNSVI
jgi:3-oxoacyl-[acyl-carrier protein] reductase